MNDQPQAVPLQILPTQPVSTISLTPGAILIFLTGGKIHGPINFHDGGTGNVIQFNIASIQINGGSTIHFDNNGQLHFDLVPFAVPFAGDGSIN